MRFYPGIPSVALFDTIFFLVKPYWKGPKHPMQFLKRTGRKKMPASLNSYDDFFKTFMRLRLGLLNEDVADRFDILPTKSSFIFTT